MMAVTRAPAATRALTILHTLATAPGPMTASTLAGALQLPRSSTYHLLDAMEREGFVLHLPEERRWGLGVKAFEIGSAYLRHGPLERLGRPLLARLTREVGETTHLGVLHGAETLYLLKERPRYPETLISDIGVRLPAQLTATGRIMLAYLPAAQVRAVFPGRDSFVDRTGHGPRSLAELRRILTESRTHGFAVEDECVTRGYASVAACVFDHLGQPLAAVGITFRRDTRPRDDWPRMAASAATTADLLTRRLGGHPQGASTEARG